MNRSTLAIAALMLSAVASAQVHQVRTQTEPVIKTSSARVGEADTWKDIGEGTYSDFVLSNLFVGYFNDPVKVQVQESEQTPGLYRVVNPWTNSSGGPFDDELNYLIIDASDPDYVMVPEQRSPVNDAVEGETWYCSYTYWAIDYVGVDKETFYNLQPNKVPQLRDGIIKFSQNCMAVMYPDGTGAEFDPGTWSYTNMEYEGYLVLPGASADDAEDWELMGTGKFLEGFLEPFFTEDYVPEEQDVEIMRNRKVEGVYKVVKAFALSSPAGRDMVIDARQPDFVRVEEQNTGVDTNLSWAYIFSVSVNGPFTDYESMVAYDPSYADRNITMDEKGIYFPKTSILIYFPLSGDYGAYRNDRSVDSYLLFPAENAVGTIGDTAGGDAPAEYFSLQGMRLTEPAPGQLVIVRKGTETYKTIIR